jgi:hypothetical protein
MDGRRLDTFQDFFDQVGHQTTYASIGTRHFFTKSCHPQTYQNYEQSRKRLGASILYFFRKSSTLKIKVFKKSSQKKKQKKSVDFEAEK